MSQLSTPILFLTFNRPEKTKRVLDTIKLQKPSRLYISSDGPRFGYEEDKEKILATRNLFTKPSSDCEIQTLYNTSNLGCKVAVSNAISWFFSHEESGIIVEDDCLPDQSFFTFCHELLEKYKDDKRIMAISGNNFQPPHHKNTSYSYYFSRYPHCWGWATWRRAWKLYDRAMKTWPSARDNDFLFDAANGNSAFLDYWYDIFEKCFNEEIDTWDYQWTYSCWVQNGLTIIPKKNLVKNIGFDSEATHTKKADNRVSSLANTSIGFPLSHPFAVVRDYHADYFTDKHIFKIDTKSVSKILLSKLKSLHSAIIKKTII